MYIGLLTLTFSLPGCGSLKEKRGRLRGLKDRFGKQPNLAVSETGLHDVHQSAQWSFVVLCANRAQGDQMLAQIEQYAVTDLDVVVVDRQLERF